MDCFFTQQSMPWLYIIVGTKWLISSQEALLQSRKNVLRMLTSTAIGVFLEGWHNGGVGDVVRPCIWLDEVMNCKTLSIHVLKISRIRFLTALSPDSNHADITTMKHTSGLIETVPLLRKCCIHIVNSAIMGDSKFVLLAHVLRRMRNHECRVRPSHYWKTDQAHTSTPEICALAAGQFIIGCLGPCLDGILKTIHIGLCVDTTRFVHILHLE